MDFKTLLLVTHNYPFYPGEQFLECEVPYLAASFKRVIVVPHVINGTPRNLPAMIELDTSLAGLLAVTIKRGTTRFLGVTTLALLRHPIKLGWGLIHGLSRQPQMLTKAFKNVYIIAVTERWFGAFLRKSGDLADGVLVYHYWTRAGILGMKLALGKDHICVRIVSRAHGQDLYEDLRGDRDWPFRDRVMQSVDRVFMVSEHGMRYLVGRRPWMMAKAEVSRLGVEDGGVNVATKNPNEIVVCSCAGMVPVKRLEMLIKALALISEDWPQCRIIWHHLGDGPLRTELEALASHCLHTNVKYIFHGQIPNDQVRAFYLQYHVDVFVNTSFSEGVPVSIMEAQSAGIPVIATAAGGTPELVNASNGLLLALNISSEDVAAAISNVITEPETWVARRLASRRTWAELSNANINYKAFVKRLKAIN